MIVKGAIRIAHKPHLRMPYVVQGQNTKGTWIFITSHPTQERAENYVAKLNRKLETDLPPFNPYRPA